MEMVVSHYKSGSFAYLCCIYAFTQIDTVFKVVKEKCVTLRSLSPRTWTKKTFMFGDFNTSHFSHSSDFGRTTKLPPLVVIAMEIVAALVRNCCIHLFHNMLTLFYGSKN